MPYKTQPIKQFSSLVAVLAWNISCKIRDMNRVRKITTYEHLSMQGEFQGLFACLHTLIQMLSMPFIGICLFIYVGSVLKFVWMQHRCRSPQYSVFIYLKERMGYCSSPELLAFHRYSDGESSNGPKLIHYKVFMVSNLKRQEREKA